MITLDKFLDGAYCERVLRKPMPGVGLAAFKATIANDPQLKTEAVARRSSLTDALCKRCFVTKIHRDVLAEILST